MSRRRGALSALFALPALAAALCALPATAQSWKRVQGVDSTRGVYAVTMQGGAWYAVSDTLVYKSADGLTWQREHFCSYLAE